MDSVAGSTVSTGGGGVGGTTGGLSDSIGNTTSWVWGGGIDESVTT